MWWNVVYRRRVVCGREMEGIQGQIRSSTVRRDWGRRDGRIRRRMGGGIYNSRQGARVSMGSREQRKESEKAMVMMRRRRRRKTTTTTGEGSINQTVRRRRGGRERERSKSGSQKGLAPQP